MYNKHSLPLKAAAYARYSSNNQSELSIEAQLSEIKEYAKNNNIVIVETYVDKAKSAKSADRPEFQRMISDAKKHKFDVILVHKLDRFSRNRYDSLTYSHLLENSNVKLISITEQFSDDPAGELVKSIIESVNEWYINNLRNEVKTKTKYAAMKGYFLGGMPPLGYDLKEVIDEYGKTRKRYAVNHAEAIIVKEIFRLYAEGLSFKKIAESLNQKGYKTKNGGKFKASSISEILRNKKYGGIYIYNQSKHGTRIRSEHDDVIKVEGAVPTIIDRDLFDKVQEKLSKRRRNIQKKHHYLLLNIAYCGACGSRLTGSGGKYPKYICQDWKNKKSTKLVSIGKTKLEKQVISYIKNLLLSIDKIDFSKLTKELNKTEAKREQLYEKQFKELQMKKSDLENKINNLVRAIEKGILIEKLEKEAKDLEIELNKVNQEIKNLHNKTINKYTEEQVREIYIEFMEQLNSDNLLVIEKVIKRLIEKVIVYPGGYVEIKPRKFL
ncbi:recombinase family protein [Thermosipho melanesiensis]|uniref:Resolvase, N-terminal domain n=2 Tax=Thermosipho melanesiensis TaxID=46541 RepID=A6LK15_THEM4|nr:recombinase family protein [Thermosipho melanesiensis]ABR30266.1 Resolvase, N-terminal domain [Thermosipho melanesiensis BI429]APT73449.1 recombinase [Thermosipho melanesiensis]